MSRAEDYGLDRDALWLADSAFIAAKEQGKANADGVAAAIAAYITTVLQQKEVER